MFQNFVIVFIENPIEGKYVPFKSHKSYIIKLKCPFTSISSSVFVSFKIILFIFDFFYGYVLFLEILRENQKKENRKEK